MQVINRRVFILNILLFFPFSSYYRPAKQTTIVKAKNHSFADVVSFKNTVDKAMINNQEYYLFRQIDLFKKLKILFRVDFHLIDNNKLRFERLWVNRKFYELWKKSNDHKRLRNNLIAINQFEILYEHIS